MAKEMQNNAGKFTVDVSKIFNGSVSEISLDFALELDDKNVDGLVFENAPRIKSKVFEKASGKGTAESFVALSVEITGEYCGECARCASDVTKSLMVNREYGVARKLVDDSEEYIEASEGILDMEEIARTLFYLELPSRILCKDDCLGLCSVCGTDLNVSICSCKAIKRGNGLEALKKLLDK